MQRIAGLLSSMSYRLRTLGAIAARHSMDCFDKLQIISSLKSYFAANFKWFGLGALPYLTLSALVHLNGIDESALKLVL